MARDMGREFTGDVTPRQASSLRVIEGGSVIEAAAGLAAVVLAILALIGVLPERLADITLVVLGVALLIEGAAVASRYGRIMSAAGGAAHSAEFGGGMTAELLGGIAAVALGILALIGIASMTLLSIGVIVLGCALLLGSGIMSRLSTIEVRTYGVHETARHAAREAVLATAGAQMLIGVGAVALGILALIGIDSLTLNIVGLLALGAAILLSGSALSAKMLSIMQG